MTVEYMRIIALGAVFQLLATGLIPFIHNMNGASFAMAAMILGFVTNIILDYTFVWIFGWGMAGAAWATIIGQAITMLAAILFFIIKKRGFYLPPFFELTSLWKNILHIAPAPFGLSFSPTVTMLVMNRFSLWYGTAQDVAVYGCIGYVSLPFLAPRRSRAVLPSLQSIERVNRRHCGQSLLRFWRSLLRQLKKNPKY